MGWVFDPTSTQIVWETTHLGLITVRGGFRHINVTGDMASDNPETWSVQVEVEAASLDSWAERRDAAMLKPDYFNAERFPAITFASKVVQRKPDGALIIHGALTMIGVTRDVTLEGH